ncbi:MAG: bifunctional folylpolyglutamate synthase/dihydrofolate synthase [Oscillospiraceae bacterium]|nr:bifunctional folylpolyglutamate synthase/dihydrofolate synthase [Oscillospiraceae bacterium]
MTYKEAMAYIQSFSKSGSPVKNLSRISNLLNELDNPHEKLQFVHIAGTNGKGSTLALSSAAAIKAGFKVGQFTSPYMIRYNDRIRINNTDIPDEMVAQLCTIVSECHVAPECSQFEITFAIALLYFLNEKCDIVFLETGLGGLLDATNIIKSPLVSVITSISPDHTNILGKTVPEIAVHKAGIIKQGCPVVLSADNDDSTIEIISEIARKKTASLRIPDFRDCRIIEESLDGTLFQYHSMDYSLKMPGIHQVYNALTAIEIVRILSMHGYLITAQNVADAFETVSVPARIQQISSEPPVLLDGSHNQGSIIALADVLRVSGRSPVVIICGMLRSKDYKTSCHIISQIADYVICVDDFSDQSVKNEELETYFRDYCPVISKSVNEALPYALKITDSSKGIIAVSGSLYLASCFYGKNNFDAL